jgi:hypothetical protein
LRLVPSRLPHPPIPLGPRIRLTIATRRLVVNIVVVTFVLPLRIAGWAASGLVADHRATQLRTLTAGVPVATFVATSAAWLFLLHGGIFYP